MDALLPSLLRLGGAAFVALLGALLWPVAFPASESLEGSAKKATRADLVRRRGAVLLAGSFNPPHKGHVAMLEHLSARYDKVYAVIGFNPSKVYPVSPEQRRVVLEAMVRRLPNVQAVTVKGYIWRFALEKRCVGVYRGIRSWQQDGAAERFLELQNRLGPPLLGLRWPLRTTFLLSSPELREVSSTEVRARVAAGEDLADLVGAEAADAIAEAWGRGEVSEKRS